MCGRKIMRKKKSGRESQGEVKTNFLSVLFLPRLWFCYEDNGKSSNFTAFPDYFFSLNIVLDCS